jgi:hypothetical protein
MLVEIFTFYFFQSNASFENMIQFNISLAISCFMLLVPTPLISAKEDVMNSLSEELDVDVKVKG